MKLFTQLFIAVFRGIITIVPNRAFDYNRQARYETSNGCGENTFFSVGSCELANSDFNLAIWRSCRNYPTRKRPGWRLAQRPGVDVSRERSLPAWREMVL
jgi:hypothetical protein